MKEYVHKYIKENQEAILHGDSTCFTADSGGSISVLRMDAVPGKSFKRMIDSLDGWMGQYVSDDDESKSGSPIYMGLGNIADSVFNFNEGQFEKGAKSVLGVEFPVGEDWWPFARDIWSNKNYGLIRSDMQKYIAQVNDLTEKAVTSGWSLSQLTKQIQGLDDKITKGRAESIARDQIGKLNGEISQRRMESVGLTMYIWETSGDERVRGDPGGKYPDARPSHYLMDGLLCRWDNPTVYSEDGGKTWIDRPANAVILHPGMDYICRCTATSYWEELVQEADKLLDYEGAGTVEGEVKRGLEYYKSQEKRGAGATAQKRAKKTALSSNQKASADYIQKVYPGEKFITQSAKLQATSKYTKGLVIPKNVKVAASRIPINSRQREVLRKELRQAEILAMLGIFVYLIPEHGPYGVRRKDAVVNGSLFEFRTITGNAKTLEWEFRDAKKKGKDVNIFLNIESNVPRNEVRRRIALVLERHPEYTGKIIVSLRGGKTYFWDSSSFR
jgi:hypothetical protein